MNLVIWIRKSSFGKQLRCQWNHSVAFCRCVSQGHELCGIKTECLIVVFFCHRQPAKSRIKDTTNFFSLSECAMQYLFIYSPNTIYKENGFAARAAQRVCVYSRSRLVRFPFFPFRREITKWQVYFLMRHTCNCLCSRLGFCDAESDRSLARWLRRYEIPVCKAPRVEMTRPV